MNISHRLHNPHLQFRIAIKSYYTARIPIIINHLLLPHFLLLLPRSIINSTKDYLLQQKRDLVKITFYQTCKLPILARSLSIKLHWVLEVPLEEQV